MSYSDMGMGFCMVSLMVSPENDGQFHRPWRTHGRISSRPHGRISFGFGYDSYELDRLKTWGWTAVEMGRYTKDTSQAGKLLGKSWENYETYGKTMGHPHKWSFIWLVVWNIWIIFSMQLGIIIPTDFNNHPNWLSYVSEGLKPPTRILKLFINI